MPVLSGHDALWTPAGPPPGTRTVVLVGGQLDAVASDFASCQVRSRLADGTGVDDEEEGRPVALCRGPRAPWPVLWARFRHLG